MNIQLSFLTVRHTQPDEEILEHLILYLLIRVLRDKIGIFFPFTEEIRLDEDDEVFNYMEMIQIEYHYGYENLVKKLKNCDFDVKYTEPKKGYNSQAENPNMYVGYIYAKRISSSKFGQK